MQKLKEKHRLFIAEYLKDRNAVQAAIRAGYSPKSAHVTAYTILDYPSVKQELDSQLKAQTHRVLMSADKILLDIKEIGDKAREEGDWKSALRSRELLGKNLALFTDKVDVNAKVEKGFADLPADEKLKKLVELDEK